MKKVLAVILVTIMMMVFTGCGNGVDLEGTYKSEENHDFSFQKDGTCSYITYSNLYSEEKKDFVETPNPSYGTWEKEGDSYKIIIEGIPCTLYGTINGDVLMVSSDSALVWTNESFSKQ